MVKPVILAIAAIPAIFALMIMVPMLTKTEIPYSAANSYDQLELEYTKHQLQAVSFGVTERVGSVKSEIMKISTNGDATYALIENNESHPENKFKVDENKMLRLTAFVKETGIISIPTESFPVRDGAVDYQKSMLKITLNGQSKQINWPEQNATDSFIPPIITQLELELDAVIDQIGE